MAKRKKGQKGRKKGSKRGARGASRGRPHADFVFSCAYYKSGKKKGKPVKSTCKQKSTTVMPHRMTPNAAPQATKWDAFRHRAASRKRLGPETYPVIHRSVVPTPRVTPEPPHFRTAPPSPVAFGNYGYSRRRR